MTLGDVIQTLQQELRKGMEQQQQRLTKETLDAIEKGLAPVHELIEKVENKATKGIQATLANAKGLSKGQEELERSIGHMTTGTAILRSRVFAIEEKIAELHTGPSSLPAPSGRAALKHRAGTTHPPSSMSSCILAPCGVELPKSRWEELGVDPTTHGTVVIPTPTSGTWGSPGSMTSTREGPRCRRCIQGPSWHGGHDRSDPACTLHGSKVRNGGEALAYLRRHQAAQSTLTTTGGKSTASTTRGTTKASTTRSTKRTLTTSATRGQPKQDPTGPRQPRAQSSSTSSSSSDDAAQPPGGEQLPLSKSTGTQLGSAGQSLAQPVSPGPWGPQDEEFEQEAWTSILGYAPGRDQEPRGAEGDHKTTATGPPPVAQPPPPKAHAATNLGTPTRGVLRGLSPLAAGAARAVPATTPVPAKLGDGTDYQKAAPKDSEHEARQMHNNTELIETTRDNHNNPDDYLHAQGLVFATQPPPTLLVPPGGPMPPHRGLHPNHDAFEDAYPTDVDAAEEPDWSRDSQDETDEEKDDDTTNLDKPGPSHGTRGSERPAEPVGAPPARPGSREDLTAEETRMERNRRARAEWREWRRQQRRRGLAPGYFYPSGAERWQRRT